MKQVNEYLDYVTIVAVQRLLGKLKNFWKSKVCLNLFIHHWSLLQNYKEENIIFMIFKKWIISTPQLLNNIHNFYSNSYIFLKEQILPQIYVICEDDKDTNINLKIFIR